MKKFVKRKAFFIVLTLLIFSVSVATMFFPQRMIDDFIKNSGNYSQLIYVVIIVLGQIFAPVGTSPLIPLGILFYGDWGYVLFTFANILGNIINFLIAKKWGWSAIEVFFGDRVGNIKNLVRRIPKKKIFLLRIIAINIHDYLSFALGLTSLTLWDFFWMSFITHMVWGLIFYITINLLHLDAFGIMIYMYLLIIPIGYYLYREFKIKS